MTFLAPLFLVGALAIGLPIVFHLIRRTTRERKMFSSLMFLMPSPPRLTQRSRLEHLLLLLLRCAAICLLTLGFARPFFKHSMPPPPEARGRRVLLLVDSSASMRRANLWSAARAKVDSVLHSAAPGDQVALFTFDRQVHPLFTFDQWLAAPLSDRAGLLARKLADSAPGWGPTHLGNALIQAAEILGETSGKTPAGEGRIELITDLQEGSRLEQLQGYEWPKNLQVSVDVLTPRQAGNASLQVVSDTEEGDLKAPVNVRVRVSNVTGDKKEQFKVGWSRAAGEGFATQPTELYVPAGQSRIVPLPVVSSNSLNRILLQGDDEDFDNLVFAIPPEPLHLNVLYVGSDPETDPKGPLYFLSRAFQQTRHEAVRVGAHAPEASIAPVEEQAASLFVVTSPLSAPLAQEIRAQAMAGKTVLVSLTSAEMQPTFNALLQLDNLKLDVAHPDNYAMLGEMDFQHPIFAPFADPRFSDFTKIHFWQYVRFDSGAVPRARVLAKFDNGDPALVEVPTGAGRVLVLASGWQPKASQLALSSKFVPLMYSILESSGVSSPSPAQYRVGDVVPLASFGVSPQAGVTVKLPDESQVSVAAGETNFSRTDLPGIYTVAAERGAAKFVVNLDPAESRTAPLPVDELERLGVPVARAASESRVAEAERKTRLQNAELENRQKLWRWFVIGTVVVLLSETWVAGRAARRATQLLQPAPS